MHNVNLITEVTNLGHTMYGFVADHTFLFQMKKMRDHGDFTYFNMYFRMMPDVFDHLHNIVRDDLTKQHVIREPLMSYERLALTLG